MQCRTVLSSIDALRTDELSAEEQRRVEEHFEICPSCFESVDDVRTFASTVKALYRAPHRSVMQKIVSLVSDHYDVIESGGRKAFIGFSDRGARLVVVDPPSFEEFASSYEARFDRSLIAGKLPAALREQVIAALEGRGTKTPLVDVTGLTPFEAEVLAALQRIPRGEVRSYSWLAREAGKPKAIRAVGNVMAHNPLPLLLPCHRVVPTSGGVGQYVFGAELKRELLEREGVPVDGLDELARQHVRFIGSATTHIFCVPTCRDAKRIRDENRVLLRDESDATRKGFRACLHCRPAA